ncbi:MAG: hypothetical protein CMH61_00295 [Nanoarchaeota archaeon]|nr:hypothetical protein [Nanoarchaeota archaeon]|tara:strand:+ start:1195 stop:1392 length:198 start_codon:yes stop_codon:yes gene_type:complete
MSKITTIGVALFIIGYLSLIIFAVLGEEPRISGILIIGGLLIAFIAVLMQRLKERKSDKYTKVKK